MIDTPDTFQRLGDVARRVVDRIPVPVKEAQRRRGLAAVRAGCQTAREVADAMNIPLESAAVALLRLWMCGLVTRVKEPQVNPAKHGRPAFVYRIAEDRGTEP